MESRRQRRALASGGYIAAAKIAYNSNACQFGQQRAVDQLYRISVARLMAYRLAVAADGCHGPGVGRTLCKQRIHDGRVFAREIICRQRGAAQLVACGLVERQQFVSQCRREALMAMPDQARLGSIQIGEYCVDTIEAGAGHQPDV